MEEYQNSKEFSIPVIKALLGTIGKFIVDYEVSQAMMIKANWIDFYLIISIPNHYYLQMNKRKPLLKK